MDIATAQICVFGSIVLAMTIFGTYMKLRSENGSEKSTATEQQTLL